jgi:hypothetical protein
MLLILELDRRQRELVRTLNLKAAQAEAQP